MNTHNKKDDIKPLIDGILTPEPSEEMTEEQKKERARRLQEDYNKMIEEERLEKLKEVQKKFKPLLDYIISEEAKRLEEIASSGSYRVGHQTYNDDIDRPGGRYNPRIKSIFWDYANLTKEEAEELIMKGYGNVMEQVKTK
jgi:hypothetical protein